MKAIKVIAIIFASAAMFASCVKENIEARKYKGFISLSVASSEPETKAEAEPLLIRAIPAETEGGQLFLNEFVQPNNAPISGEEAETKGSVVTTENLGTLKRFKEFGMDSYILTDASEMNENEWIAGNSEKYPCYFEGGMAHKVGTTWYLDNGSGKPFYNWLLDTDFAFWSYAPANRFEAEEGTVFGKTGGIVSGYEVPGSVAEQEDLIVAYTQMNSGDGKEPVKINFKHALSTVVFKLNLGPDCTIENVYIKDAASKGDLHIGVGSNGPSFEWRNLTGRETEFTTDFVEEEDFSSETASGRKIGYQDRDEDKVFFMIPMSGNISIAVKIAMDYGGTFTVTANNVRVDWEPGMYYTYQISADAQMSVTVTEEFDGSQKDNVKLKNGGIGDMYVRAAVVGAWMDKDENYIAGWKYDKDKPEYYGFTAMATSEDNGTGWLLNPADGFYYYAFPLSPTEETKNLFDKFVAPTSTLEGAHFDLIVHAQAVQPEYVEDAWPFMSNIITK